MSHLSPLPDLVRGYRRSKTLVLFGFVVVNWGRPKEDLVTEPQVFGSGCLHQVRLNLFSIQPDSTHDRRRILFVSLRQTLVRLINHKVDVR
jgi:hypothetical protein